MTYLNGGGGGQLLGRGSLAIFKQDSMKTAVIIPAFHKQENISRNCD